MAAQAYLCCWVTGIHLPGRHEPEMSLEAALSEARRGLV